MHARQDNANAALDYRLAENMSLGHRGAPLSMLTTLTPGDEQVSADSSGVKPYDRTAQGVGVSVLTGQPEAKAERAASWHDKHAGLHTK